MKRFRLIIVVTLIFVISTLAKALSQYYPDILWFESLNLQDVWWRSFTGQATVFIGVFSVAFIWFFLNILIAKYISSSTPKTDKKTAFFEHLKNQMGNTEAYDMIMALPKKLNNMMVFVGAVLVSLLMAYKAKAFWHIIYSFINQVQFHVKDPLFGKDISFYVFSLPLLSLLYKWAYFLIFLTIAITIWIYLSHNLLKSIISKTSIRSRAKIHVFILLGLFVLVLAFGKWISIFEVLFSSRGVVFGAGFSEVYAQLPVYKGLLWLLIAEAILLFIWAFRSGILVPGLFFILIIGLTVLGQIAPNMVQRYVVSLNEFEKEESFIKDNINYSRQAYGLDNVIEKEFPVSDALTRRDIQKNKLTVDNIRLWEPGPLKSTLSQLQEIRPYYEFSNVDVDRYVIDGSLQQVMLSPRELDVTQLDPKARTWQNQHFVYTHGYGICMTPVNRVTSKGLPLYILKDIPPVSDTNLQVSRPEIYFGENTKDYVIVNSSQKEFDYPSGDKNEYTHYKGKGGVRLNSLIKRAIFSYRYSKINLLLTPLINQGSRILFDRDIMTMVKKIAPFLVYDHDPYITLTDRGRLVWILDAYTLSDKYPYSEPFNNRFNYIKNAVKVTIDAYSGEVQFYMADNKDPIILTYNKIYPTLFQSMDDMPVDIRSHVRYPKGLFGIQSRMYATYHMTDPQVFLNREDVWGIPQKGDQQSNPKLRDSFYMVTKIPGDKHESFVLMLPFTPKNKNNMIAWMGAKCDAEEYGQLHVFNFPKKRTVYGPTQIESRIDQDTDISQKLTLWDQSGSSVIRGELMVLPIEESLIYVQPIYLQATQSKLPELKRVIIAYEETIIMRNTLEEAFEEIFSDLPNNVEDNELLKKTVILQPNNNASLETSIQELVKEYELFKKSAENKDWVQFGQRLNHIDKILKEIVKYDKL